MGGTPTRHKMAKAGDRISEYVLEAPVGRGGFGEVWRAHHHVWQQQRVAIKLPHQADYIRQLQREGLAVQGLEHPNIVKALGFDPFADPPYLVMEFVDGGSLRPMIQRREITIERAAAITSQLLAALKYAHGKGIVHRDIKPENILMAADASAAVCAKLTDFGVGTSTAATSMVYSMSIENGASNIAGTLDYMSPEQRSGGAVDARSDLYAVGVVLFEMLTGEKPAGGEVPGDLNPAVPAYLNDSFRRAYARLDKRFASADEFAATLRPALPPLSITPPKLPSAGSCPRCRKHVDTDDQFCMHCGVQLTPVIRRCPHCRAYPSRRDTFCIQCGKLLPNVVSSMA